MTALSRERLFDQLFDAYFAWRETCARVNDAYHFWASETGVRGRIAFGAYTAALDAEELAAAVYGGFVSRADELPWSEDLPAKPRRKPPSKQRWGVGWP